MPEPIPNLGGGFFNYQFHQVAMFCPNGVRAAVRHWERLGYTNWIEDTAELKGILHGVPVTTSARMLFNYDIMPMELEFLHYNGPSRWEGVTGLMGDPFISHMSVYVEDVVKDTRHLTNWLGIPPFHRFITQKHTNPGVAGKKRFIESIFDTHSLLGYDTKLIQKVPHDFDDDEWLNRKF